MYRYRIYTAYVILFLIPMQFKLRLLAIQSLYLVNSNNSKYHGCTHVKAHCLQEVVYILYSWAVLPFNNHIHLIISISHLSYTKVKFQPSPSPSQAWPFRQHCLQACHYLPYTQQTPPIYKIPPIHPPSVAVCLQFRYFLHLYISFPVHVESCMKHMQEGLNIYIYLWYI